MCVYKVLPYMVGILTYDVQKVDKQVFVRS